MIEQNEEMPFVDQYIEDNQLNETKNTESRKIGFGGNMNNLSSMFDQIDPNQQF